MKPGMLNSMERLNSYTVTQTFASKVNPTLFRALLDQGEAQSDRQLCLMRRAMDLG